MPSARDAKYGAPPEASRSPRRCNSSVRVIRSMACWVSPSAIICVKTRRCWSRKKSSARRFSMAAFSALLSSRIAPSTERSASRLLGRGFSRVVSTGIELAYNSPFLRYMYHNAQYEASVEIYFFAAFPCRTYFQTLQALCAEVFGASIGVAVHRSGKTVQKFFALAKIIFCANKKGTQTTASLSCNELCRKLFHVFFFDVDLYGGVDVAEDLDGHGVIAESLDGLGDVDLALVHLEVLRRERFGDVAAGDGAEHLLVFAGLALKGERNVIQQSDLLLRALEFRGGFLGQGGADTLQCFHVAASGFDGHFAREQKITGVAGLDGDDVAAVAELFDVFLKNDFHDRSLAPYPSAFTVSTAFGASTGLAASAGFAASTGLAASTVFAASTGLWASPPATTWRGCCVPLALPAKGSRAILRARLMATPSQRWWREQTPVIRRGRILPRSWTNCDRMSARL